jgi:Galactose oxidase, central domain
VKYFYILLLILFSCVEKPTFGFIEPEIFVSTAYLLSFGNTIEVNCETINPSSINKEEFGICWSEKPNPTKKDNYQYAGNNSIQEGPFSKQITNIKPNTTYYIKGYMKIKGKDVYSKDFIYNPEIAKGWNRLEDIPRVNNLLNLPFAYLQSNSIPAFKRKLAGFEESVDYIYNDQARFWFNTVSNSKLMVYDQFFADIEYGPGKFDTFSGGGYIISNSISGKTKYLKAAKTETYSKIDDYPGADGPAVAFGAGNKGFVIEVRPNPDLWAFNEEDFQWEKMKKPPFSNFTGIKATRANGDAIVVLENALDKNEKNQVYLYNFQADNWTQLENFPGIDRVGGILFSIKNNVYFGLGEQKNNENGLKDVWEYNLSTKKWIQISNYPGAGSTNLAYVKKGNSVYIGMGYSSLLTDIGTSRKFPSYDFWEFRP